MTSSPPPSPSPSPSTASAVVAPLLAIYAAHDRAVLAYPLIGVHLTDAGEVMKARTLQSTHADRRDAVGARLVALGANPATASAPTASQPLVTDVQSAHQQAVLLEERLAAACRYLVVSDLGAAAADRTADLAALTQAAGDAVFWRRRIDPNKPTVPFAGA